MMGLDNGEKGEESQLDGLLESVRDFNKYLRKALKKISALQETLSSTQSVTDQDGNLEHGTKRPADDASDSTREKRPKKSMDNDLEFNKRNLIKVSSAQEFVNDKMLNNSKEIVNEDNRGGEQNRLISDRRVPEVADFNADMEDADAPTPLRTGHSCVISRLDEPVIFFALREFYKASITNLPLTADVPKLQEWLRSKNLGNYEHVMIHPKATYKSAVVAYYDKYARNRLLLLDGEMYHNRRIKVYLYVDEFTPMEDRIWAKERKKKSNPKKK